MEGEEFTKKISLIKLLKTKAMRSGFHFRDWSLVSSAVNGIKCSCILQLYYSLVSNETTLLSLVIDSSVEVNALASTVSD